MVRHIIHRQQIILNLSKREYAGALQASVSNLMQHELEAGIDAVFNNVFPEDQIIRIDRLQLDLGTVNQQNFENEFKAQLLSELTKGLLEQKDNLDYADGAGVLSKEQSLIGALIYFLEKGYLPWYQSVATMDAWETEMLSSFTARQYQQFFEKVLLKQPVNEAVIERLVQQFSNKFLGGLLSGGMPEFSVSWELIYNDMALIMYSLTDQTNTVRSAIWRYVFQALPERKDNKLSYQVLEKLASHFNIKADTISAEKEEEILANLQTNIVEADFKELVICLKQLFETKKTKTTDKDADPGAVNNTVTDPDQTLDNYRARAEGPGVENDDPSSAKKEETKTSQRKKDAQVIAGDVIFVTNSGTVILHPFLKPYFESLELLAEKKFVSDEARQRAVLLLHYLATGETKVAEFNLTLQKVMCGHPLDDTLPDELLLTEKEITESENLLNSVTNYWVPLNNTSIQGLRNSFLQREGKLELKENGWLLTIEQKTLDILLGKLPWGISTIRLPWMEQLLNVDWY